MSVISLKCPQCGGSLEAEESRKVIKCLYCSADVSLVRLASQQDNASGDLMSLARVASEARNWDDAYTYYSRALEIDSTCAEAWFGKGESAGWQSNLRKARLEEMMVCFGKAIECSSVEEEKVKMRVGAAQSVLSVSKALYDLSVSHLLEFISVPDAKYDHIDRCMQIVLICDRAHVFDQDNLSIPEFLLSVCSTVIRLSGISQQEKEFFTSSAVRFRALLPANVLKQVDAKQSCFVVTATMGRDDNGFVRVLRVFRDNVLNSYGFGKSFISWYYKHGPDLARVIEGRPLIRVLAFFVVVLPAAVLASMWLLMLVAFGGRK